MSLSPAAGIALGIIVFEGSRLLVLVSGGSSVSVRTGSVPVVGGSVLTTGTEVGVSVEVGGGGSVLVLGTGAVDVSVSQGTVVVSVSITVTIVEELRGSGSLETL